MTDKKNGGNENQIDGIGEVVEVHVTPGKTEITVKMAEEVASNVAFHMAEIFRLGKGEAHVRWQIHHEELGPLEMIMRRIWAGSPEQVAEQRLRERNEARAEVNVRDRAMAMMHEAALKKIDSVAAIHALAFPEFWVEAAREQIDGQKKERPVDDGKDG